MQTIKIQTGVANGTINQLTHSDNMCLQKATNRCYTRGCKHYKLDLMQIHTSCSHDVALSWERLVVTSM